MLALTWFVTAYAFHIWMSTPSERALRSWDQPEAVSYPDGKRYTLHALEGSRDPSYGPLEEGHRLVLVVTLHGSPPSHPLYWIELEPLFGRDSVPLEHYVSGCEVEWTAQGVTFRDGSFDLTIRTGAIVRGRLFD